MLTDVGFLLAGAALLYLGGDWLVDGARGLAARFGVSPLFVGIVIMGFGTSAPEIVVTVDAALTGSHDVAIGNVVGSNIANLCLILAITAMLSPVMANPTIIRFDGPAMVLATFAFAALALDGQVGRLDALVLMAAAFGYFWLRLHGDRSRDRSAEELDGAADMPAMRAAGLAVVGIIALPCGAHVFLDGAVGVAVLLGVSEAIIGVSLVALGTSLPELTACVMAARKNRGDMALGNVLGSNVFNSTIVIGIAATTAPIQVSAVFAEKGLWLMIATSLAAIVFLRTGYVLSRREGGVMLAGYGAILYLLY